MRLTANITIPVATILLLVIGAIVGPIISNSSNTQVPETNPPTTPAPTEESAPPTESPSTPQPTEPEKPQEETKKAEKLLVEKFYTAHAKMDKEIFSYFTPPADKTEETTLNLFKDGRLPDGSPGGPVVWETSTAAGSVKSYQITDQTQSGETFMFTIAEKADYPTAKSVDRTRKLEVVKVGDEYKVKSYHTQENKSKYSGFLY